jgi:hypothetical protein
MGKFDRRRALLQSKFAGIAEDSSRMGGDGILVNQAKEIVESVHLTEALVDIENCYYCLARVIIRMEESDCGIVDGINILNSLDFKRDPCGIGEYVTERINRNEILQVVNCSRSDISIHLFALLQKFSVRQLQWNEVFLC